MELSSEIITVLMFTAVLVGVLTGYPLGLVMGIIAVAVGYMVWGSAVGDVIYPRMFHTLTNYILLAIPCFIFMGTMLERTGIAERVYDALYIWLGGLKGGLAIVTIMIGAIMAACLGIVSASVAMLGIVALPSMIKHGYDKSLASGSVCAAGCLGISFSYD